jgi:hypothetical protein
VDAGTLTSEILRRAAHGYGIEVSLPEYDLRKREDRSYLLQWLEEEKPAHVFMAPPCTTWSKIQRTNSREDQVEQRTVERETQEKTCLKLVAQIFKMRKEQNLPTTMEHPNDADSWKTRTLQEIEDITTDIVVDRCSTSLKVYESGEEKPVRKNTRLRTTSSKLVEMLQDAKCQCKESHGTLRGEQLRQSQNYEPTFAATMAEAIIQDDHGREDESYEYCKMAQNDDETETSGNFAEEGRDPEEVQEEQQQTEAENKIRGKYNNEVINAVKKSCTQI